MPQGLDTALGHNFDRQAAIEIGCAFPLLEFGLAAVKQCLDECTVLFLVHWAVDVVLASAAGADLVVSGLEPADIQVDRIEMDDRRDCVEEGQRVRACCCGNRIRERGCGEGTRCEYDAWSQSRGQAGHFFANNGDERMRLQSRGDRGGKAIAVNRQRTSSRNLVRIPAAMINDPASRISACKQPDGIGLGVIGTKRIGTDQFRQTVRPVRIRAAHRAHLVKDGRNAGLGCLPCGFGAGETAADDMNGLCRHGVQIV